MGVRLRRVCPHVRTTLYDCVGLPAGSDEEGNHLLAILYPSVCPHPAPVRIVHDSLQYPTDAMGSDRRSYLGKGLVPPIAQLPNDGRSLVVHVSAHQPLSVHLI